VVTSPKLGERGIDKCIQAIRDRNEYVEAPFYRSEVRSEVVQVPIDGQIGCCFLGFVFPARCNERPTWWAVVPEDFLDQDPIER
jgi:hypothetical protein